MRTASLLLLLSTALAVNAGVRIDLDEPKAVLAILEKRGAVTEEDWQRLFATEGYVRLKQREAAMQRAFDDESFRAFVLSDDLAKRAGVLARTVEGWSKADVSAATRRALAYLPAGMTIDATIYPMIKPRTNSFVFEGNAIFKYVDPDESAAKFENTMAHELHHIGQAQSCVASVESLSQPLQDLRTWLSAFGEGEAMLAAAGGPNVHPHAVSNAEERARWNRDMEHWKSDLRVVEKFLLRVKRGELKGDAQRAAGMEFFGVQGPWYTVGWQMSVAIEKAFGRKALIDASCDRRTLIPTYNRAARKLGLPQFSHELADAFLRTKR